MIHYAEKTAQTSANGERAALMAFGGVGIGGLIGAIRQARAIKEFKALGKRDDLPRADLADASLPVLRSKEDVSKHLGRTPLSLRLARFDPDSAQAHYLPKSKTDGRPAYVFPNRKPSKAVYDHEAGHAAQDADADAVKRRPNVSALLGMLLGMKHTPLYQHEEDAWNRGNVPEDNEERRAALKTYARALDVPRLAIAGGLTGLVGAKLLSKRASTFTEGEIIDYFLQHHKKPGRPSGSHADLRLGRPGKPLESWAIPKERLPEPGEKLLAPETYPHEYGYGRFAGKFGKGRNASEVSLLEHGQATVGSSRPGVMTFSIKNGDKTRQFALVRMKTGKKWIIIGQNAPKTEVVAADSEIPAKTAAYEPPYPLDKLPSHLAEDPVHRWRAESGIELVHEEPDWAEFDRIRENWKHMTPAQQATSDAKSVELFGVTNAEHAKQLRLRMLVKRVRGVLQKTAQIRHTVITGPPASGKTTLARRKADELELPLLSLDDIAQAGDDPIAAFNNLTSPHVVEGSQLAGVVDQAKHDVTNLDADDGTLVDRLLRRGWREGGIATGKLLRGEENRQLADAIIANYRAALREKPVTDVKAASGMVKTVEVPLKLVSSTGARKAEVLAEVADTAEKRAQGLSGRNDLPEKRGMFFDVPGPFWMKDVNMPLDIIFMSKSGSVLDFCTMEVEDPCAQIDSRTQSGQNVDKSAATYKQKDLKLYKSASLEAVYALEVPAGWAKRCNVGEGDRFEIET